MRLASLFSLALLATGAADWPSFRGPNNSGVSAEPDLPVKWAKDSFLWKVKLPGPGAASPIVSGDKVFVVSYTGYGATPAKVAGKDPFGKGKDPFGKGKGPFGKGKGLPGGNDQKQLRRVLSCVDVVKGQVLWQKEVAAKLPEQPYSGMILEHGYASSTPVTDGERVYVFYGKTGVLAYDFTGKQLWQTSVGTGLYLYGSAASLALYKNLVLVNAHVESKALIALDKLTGKEVWRSKGLPGTWATPAVVTTKDGKAELVMNMPNKIAAYDPETGKELWYCQGLPVPTMGGSYSTPVFKDGVVYVAGGSGPGSQATTVAVRAGGRGDVNKRHVLWRAKAGTTVNSPVVHGDYLYLIDGIATCLRLDTGKAVYKQRVYSTAGEYPSPVIAGDKIYMPTRHDGLFVLSTGAKYQLLARNTFAGDDSTFNASPAVSNGRIFVRSDAYLYCVGRKPAT